MPPQDQQNNVPATTPPTAPPPMPPPMPRPSAGGMSPAVQGVVVLIALAVLAGAIYWYMSGNTAPGGEQATGETPSATLPTGGSTADGALDTDLNAIDAQLGAFTSDNTSVNQGLGDTPVDQAQI